MIFDKFDNIKENLQVEVVACGLGIMWFTRLSLDNAPEPLLKMKKTRL